MRSGPRSSTRAIGILMAIWMFLYLPVTSRLDAQTDECLPKDSAPSLSHAQALFRAPDLRCAELELRSLLSEPTLSDKIASEAHALLACVLFIKHIGNEETQRTAIFPELLQAIKLNPKMDSNLEIEAPLLRELLMAARQRVAQERADSLAAFAASDDLTAGRGSKKRTWLYLAGGVVLTGVAVALLINGKENGEDGTALPDFPAPPGQ